MKPGVYVLTRDVENPKSDARHRHDWRKAKVWLKGTRFFVRLGHYGETIVPEIHTGRWTYMTLFIRDGHSEYDSTAPAALLDALEPVAEAAQSIVVALQVAGCEGWLEEGIDHLIKSGVLKVSQVVAACRAEKEKEGGS